MVSIFSLTDRGQINFATYVAGLDVGVAHIQYADGKFTPIAVAGKKYAGDVARGHGRL